MPAADFLAGICLATWLMHTARSPSLTSMGCWTMACHQTPTAISSKVYFAGDGSRRSLASGVEVSRGETGPNRSADCKPGAHLKGSSAGCTAQRQAGCTTSTARRASCMWSATNLSVACPYHPAATKYEHAGASSKCRQSCTAGDAWLGTTCRFRKSSLPMRWPAAPGISQGTLPIHGRAAPWLARASWPNTTATA